MQSAQISNRSCLRPLQRAITAFGADQPFRQAVDKPVEHYWILICESTTARTAQQHAKAIFESAPPAQSWPTKTGISAVIIVDTDGGMVPIVDIDNT